jgi:choline kinase
MPYTANLPKCLVEINGVSLLHTQLEVLRSRGVSDIVIVGGYLESLVANSATRLYVNRDYQTTNMVWSLLSALDEIEGDLLISYGDIVYSGEIVDSLMAADDDICVAVDMRWEEYWRARFGDPLLDAETLRLDPNSYILEIGKRPQSLEEIQGQYMGLIRLNSNGARILRNKLQAGGPISEDPYLPIEAAFMTDLLQSLVDSGYKVKGVPIDSSWVEVDSVSDLRLDETSRRLALIRRQVQEGNA